MELWAHSAIAMKKSDLIASAAQNRITTEQLNEFNDETIAVLAKRLDEDDYSTPFEGLGDWHLLRALAIHRPELVRPYLHLIDQEPFDED